MDQDSLDLDNVFVCEVQTKTNKMDSHFQEVLDDYIENNKQLSELRKQQQDLKKKNLVLETKVKEYMLENKMDSLSFAGGDIVIYERKVSETFKKPSLIENLKPHLSSEAKAEAAAESILNNKVFSTKSSIKVKTK